jgi:hypothetical protein
MIAWNGCSRSRGTGAQHPWNAHDAGEFYVGFGIVAPSDDETTEFSTQGMTQNGRAPFRHSLAVTLYGDSLRGSLPLSPEVEDAFTSVLARVIDSDANSRRVIDSRPLSRKAKRRKRQ